MLATPVRLTSLALLAACATPEPIQVSIDLHGPTQPSLGLSVEDGPGGPTWKLQADPRRLADCSARLRWRDGLGGLLESELVELDASARAHGSAPAFAVAWQLVVELSTPVAEDPGESRRLRTFLVTGGPSLATPGLGQEQLVYQALVHAKGPQQALLRAEPLALGLLDAPVSTGVDVCLRASLTRTTKGLRLGVATTGPPPQLVAYLDGQLAVGPGGARSWEHHELFGWHLLEAELGAGELAPIEGTARHQRRLGLQLGDRPSSMTRVDLRAEFQP